ncbi:MAG: vWA domain-containing protein, partial [Ruminiclostridium sp.]
YKYTSSSWAFLVPLTIVLFFIVGAALQFVYQFNIGKAQNADDIVMLVDSSGSMAQSDPSNQRLQAAQMLVDKMTDENRVSVIAFNQDSQVVQPMIQVNDDKIKQQIKDKIAENLPDGGTDLQRALDFTLKQIDETSVSGRAPMVILLSDGISKIDLKDSIAPFIDRNITIHTVGMMIEDIKGTDLLNNISDETGGNYYSVKDPEELTNVFQKIYMNKDRRLLVDRRNGKTVHNDAYTFLRILFITIIGVLIGTAVGLIFDNKYLVKSFSIGGVASGLIAGVILEVGFINIPMIGVVYRCMADVALATIFTLFSLTVIMNEKSAALRDINRESEVGSYRSFSSKEQSSKRNF